MARPKLGDGETQRLHVMISGDELTAIDDWRFANRVGSRSEAVRLLVHAGMETPDLRSLASEVIAFDEAAGFILPESLRRALIASLAKAEGRTDA